MEIKGPAHEDRPDDRARIARRADITRPNREAIEASNPPLFPPEEREVRAGDRVEVSETARRMTEGAEETDRANDRQRAERVAELRRAHERGELNTNARVEEAAVKLLEGP